MKIFVVPPLPNQFYKKLMMLGRKYYRNPLANYESNILKFLTAEIRGVSGGDIKLFMPPAAAASPRSRVHRMLLSTLNVLTNRHSSGKLDY